MKDDAVIKDNEAVYLINEQTYLHLRENLAGVGYEVFDKNSPLPVEEGQIPWEALGNTQRRIETARAYYLAEHQDESVGKMCFMAVIRCLHTKWAQARPTKWRHLLWKQNALVCARKAFSSCPTI